MSSHQSPEGLSDLVPQACYPPPSRHQKRNVLAAPLFRGLILGLSTIMGQRMIAKLKKEAGSIWLMLELKQANAQDGVLAGVRAMRQAK